MPAGRNPSGISKTPEMRVTAYVRRRMNSFPLANLKSAQKPTISTNFGGRESRSQPRKTPRGRSVPQRRHRPAVRCAVLILCSFKLSRSSRLRWILRFKYLQSARIQGQCKFRITVLNNKKGEAHGTLKLQSGSWQVQPAEAEFKLSRKGEIFTTSFVVQIPAAAKSGDYPVEAVATVNGQEFRRGYHAISYPENWTRNFYFPAESTIERFEVKTAPNLTVGYIPGAGDDVPGALEQLGVKVQMLSAADLAFGDLGRFPVIVTGIRAYNVNEDLRANNGRLLDYVHRGGTLIVQYVRPIERPARGSAGSPFLFGPYPMSVSESDRITVEDSPVKILDPGNPVFSRPNKITETDFSGWVQERGLCFMDTWDSNYQALLSGNDPGDKPQNGGMLYTQYGKGHYIYTAYAWFRQLPAGVPGAFRIFANMLSLGQAVSK